MAGFAKTKKVLLSTATVMIGPQADLHKLNPDDHSLGLVKNFSTTSDPQMTELTQGINNQIVMSVKTGENLQCSFEVYEYTLRNLAYAAGLDGSAVNYDSVSTQIATLKTTTTANASTIVLTGDVTAAFVANSYIYIQEGSDDKVHIGKIQSVTATTDTTITLATGFTLGAKTFAAGSKVGRVKALGVGGSNYQPDFAAKVVGILPSDGVPITLLFPRVKITGGLGLSFQGDNFGNMPFEFTPYAQVAEDPFYEEYGSVNAVLMVR